MKMINLYKNKTKLLLIELLLEQYGTQKLFVNYMKT